MTFGCPLDKFVYFFRTKTSGYQTIRTHILDDLHGYRRIGLSDDGEINHEGFAPPDPVRWLNISAALDPISSTLAFFKVDQEERRWYGHTNYWHDPSVYRSIVEAVVAVR